MVSHAFPRIDRRLHVGMIGAGWVTQHHLATWRRESSRARGVAITDPAIGSARGRAQAFAIPSAHADATTMLSIEKLDAVDIATPRERMPTWFGWQQR